MREIYHITRYPKSSGSNKRSRNPFTFLYRCRYPFRNYHYMIHYTQAANGDVVIEDILYDHQLSGLPTRKGLIKPAWQRPMLYHVKAKRYAPYDGPKSREVIGEMAGLWEAESGLMHQVTTQHAAVNGMQNNFDKAIWLMGGHSQAAYPEDKIMEYTLLHNPTDGGLLDVIECAFDKRKGRKSHNAQQLAAALRQCQQLGKKVKWTVHSQGTIIFCAALEELRKRGSGTLSGQQVVIHGSGANLERTTRAAAQLGMQVSRVANNPYDLVPNIAGANHLSMSGLKRSMQFCGLVFGNSVGASPHTLPYLGVETYRTQLQMLGFNKHAAIVERNINKYADEA